MNIYRKFKYIILVALTIVLSFELSSQEIQILEHNINPLGQVQLKINSSSDHYYILQVRHKEDLPFSLSSSFVAGQDNTMILTESTAAYPVENYQVISQPISQAVDTDADGVDDWTEFNNYPIQNPINSAKTIDQDDGTISLDSFSNFVRLSHTRDHVQWSEFLNGKGYVKFVINDFDSPTPQTYFIDSKKHLLHQDFIDAVDLDIDENNIQKGQIIFHPTVTSNNGTLGAFAFNYSNGHSRSFDIAQKTYECLAANMPFIQNSLSYFITSNSQIQYQEDVNLYNQSRIPILLEEDVYADVDYWGLNPAEGYGLFRKMNPNDIPSSKDIVLYESLPNSLPRVGGIITSVIQTPLSHVNLRAIQNEIPNAYIKEPLSVDSINQLLDHYIYYKVESDKYMIKAASIEEVNDWYASSRPKEPQKPPLNLTYKSILPLDEISFYMYDGFGAKCANIATMRTFSFPDHTIPNGYGIPFYFYQAFMRYNNFYNKIDRLISLESFQSSREQRDVLLKKLRKEIKEAPMPSWMMDALTQLQRSFPDGTSIRCRSSSNNEDLPGFNGAGLYTSKTQHPHEGHISKSIKQVYASLWNLRAFEEREFSKINHFVSAMAILCHPNYENELVNGVALSKDPIYNNPNMCYLNTQLGEDLITNPSGQSIPEEILLERLEPYSGKYIILQYSSLLEENRLILESFHLKQLAQYLDKIHQEFKLLYKVQNDENFAMDIEYKVTEQNQLIIKQARPWAAYKSPKNEETQDYDNPLVIFPNPTNSISFVSCNGCNLSYLQIFNTSGQLVEEISLNNSNNPNIQVNFGRLPKGTYFLRGISNTNSIFYSQKIIVQ